MYFFLYYVAKADSESSVPSESDDVVAPKSKRKKPKKGRKPKLGDKMSGDDETPYKNDLVASGVPGDNPENLPGLKEKKKPRKKQPSHPLKSDNAFPETVSLIYYHWVILMTDTFHSLL